MRVLGWGALAAALAWTGCTTVKLAKRDGCWVERRENLFGQVHEEIGPCSRPAPKWSEDRLTRLVQECVAEADHRSDARAVEAWAKRQPAPAQPRQEDLLRACMQEARTALAAEHDLTTLRARVAELSTERDALRADLDRDRAKLQESQTQLAEWLGKAAQKPPGNATATSSSTATGSGRAGSEGGATMAVRGRPPETRSTEIALGNETPAPAPSAAAAPTSPPTATATVTLNSSPAATATSTPASASNPTAPETSTATVRSQTGESYSRNPTPSRTKPVPSSSRRSTGCSR
jgi:hypothetical protein